MTPNEFLPEIGYATELGPLSIGYSELKQHAVEVGNIDQSPVFLYKANNQELFFLQYEDKIAALALIVDKQYLQGITSITKKKGVITALITFIVRKLGRRLIIGKNEGLTSQGLQWLQSIIKSGGRGLRFTSAGNNVDLATLSKEWAQSIETDVPGPTEIVIEGSQLTEEKFGLLLLMPLRKYIGDPKNL